MAYSQTTENRVPCEIQGCSTNFARLADMRRHVKEVHRGPKRCPEPNCHWRGAKRDERLEDHKMKAHPEIYTEIVLDVPEGFGTPSPQLSERSMGGSTMNSYFALSEESGLKARNRNSSLPEPQSLSSIASNNHGISIGTSSDGSGLLPASWDLPMANGQANFDQTIPRYQTHPILPSEVLHTNIYSSPLYHNSPESMVEGVYLDNSGHHRQRPDDGNIQHQGNHRSWS